MASTEAPQSSTAKRGNKMKIMPWCLLLAILLHAGQLTHESTQAFRVVPIPKRDNYCNFASTVFMSKKELESFLTDPQIGWNNRQEFEDALVNAKLDFSKEALVLLRHTEPSGSVQVTFETPSLQGRILQCEIRGKPIPPGFMGTADIACYCFAVAVSKSQVSQVELQAIQGGFSARRLPPIVLPIIEKEPSNKLPPPVEQNQVPDCPGVSVTCPDAGKGEKKSIRFKAYVTGGKPAREFWYNWSVSKGTISFGQGTAVIEVEVADTDLESLTATVEVGGLDPSCARIASCSIQIP
jgi:hypothetical protein